MGLTPSFLASSAKAAVHIFESDDAPERDDSLDYRQHFQEYPVQLLILDHDLRATDANERFFKNTGSTRDQIMGNKIFDVLPADPQHRAPVEQALRAALDGKETSVVELYYPMPDSDGPPGAQRDVWWTATHRPLRNAQGQITHVIQASEPVTEKVQADRMSAAISSELEHRIGNLLTLVLTVAKRTAQSESDLKAFMANYERRIIALASTSKLLTGKNLHGLNLEALLRAHLDPYLGEGSKTAIRISGPDLHIHPDRAQSFSLALHELTANAAKYGAFFQQSGELSVTWGGSLESDFWFSWVETNISIDGQPDRKGFGTEILTRIFPAQIGLPAQTRFDADQFAYQVGTNTSGDNG